MPANIDDIRHHFATLSDEALLGTEPGDLTESARLCFEEEIARRGLGEPGSGDRGSGDAVAAAEGASEDGAEDLVTVATYTVYDEANLALGLLRSAEIPCGLKNRDASLGVFELMLIVPASFEEAALEVLGSEMISDEELAAQAEAAGLIADQEVSEEVSEEDSDEGSEDESEDASDED